MLNMFLFLAGVFLLTFLLGRLVEKIRVPWIFTALIIGVVLSISNPFQEITSSQSFIFLAQLGMYFLLFIIGFELDVNELLKQSKFIFTATFFIILFEAFFGSLLVHFIFGCNWLISIIIALSFATVGEAVLVPILDEFKMVNSKLGQSIIGIGMIDDLVEITMLVAVAFLIGEKTAIPHESLGIIVMSLAALFLLAFGLKKLSRTGKKFAYSSIETLFLVVIFLFFLFLGVGSYAEATALGALLAGVSLKAFVPEQRLCLIEDEIKALCYGFFAPIFFLWVGSSVSFKYIVDYPLLVFLVVIVSSIAKLLGTVIIGAKHLGLKQAITAGIGLSVRFSTSIVVVKLLYEFRIISIKLYSILIASSIVFILLIPVLFSNLLVKWNFKK